MLICCIVQVIGSSVQGQCVRTIASINNIHSTDKTNDGVIADAAAERVAAPASDSRGVERFFDGKVFDPANPKAYLKSLAIKRVEIS